MGHLEARGLWKLFVVAAMRWPARRISHSHLFVVPLGDFRIHIGYLAAASLAATGPAVVICRSHAWPWPEEHADVADVRCRGLPVHRVGHLVQNVMRIMEMPSGTAIGVAPGQKSSSQ